MSDAPLALRDDDFETEPPPPGYLSQKHKDRFLPLTIGVLFVMFVAQTVLPFVVAFSMPGSNPFNQGVEQFGKFAFWQDALWYPTFNPFGGAANRGRLVAMDLEGKPLDRPAISLDMQPQWLIGDGEMLWVVSNNEVAEVFADGSTPLIMRPGRYLLNPSKPFLHDGQLMVFDRDEGEPFHWYAFSNGEWNDQGEVSLPAESWSSDAEDGDVLPDADPEAPADALEPSSPIDDTTATQVLPQPNFTPYASSFANELALKLAAISTPEGLVLFAASEGSIYYRLGVPMATEGAATADWSDWEFVAAGNVTMLHAILVGGKPAVVFGDQQDWNVWRKSDGKWNALPSGEKFRRSGYFSDLGVAVLPDGERTLMIVEEFGGGFGVPLLELKADGITQIAMVGTAITFNPFADIKEVWQWPLMLSQYAVLIAQVLLLHWLIQTHRDPNYYKGANAVAYASVLRRSIAAVIDTAIVYAPVVVLWWVFFPEFTDPMQWIGQVEGDPTQFLLDFLTPLGYTAAWMFGCWFVMWLMLSFGGFSPGKLVCGVRVATTNLDRPGLLRGLIRSIIWSIEISFFNGLAALVLIAFTPSRQRLADLVGGLVVLKASSLRKARQVAAH